MRLLTWKGVTPPANGPCVWQARLDLHSSPTKGNLLAHAALAASANAVNGRQNISTPASGPAANGWHKEAGNGHAGAGGGSDGQEPALGTGHAAGVGARRVTVELTTAHGAGGDQQVILQLLTPPDDGVHNAGLQAQAGDAPGATHSASQTRSAADNGLSQNTSVASANGTAISSRSASPALRLQTAAGGSGGSADATTLHKKV